jgi:hypothetical protein
MADEPTAALGLHGGIPPSSSVIGGPPWALKRMERKQMANGRRAPSKGEDKSYKRPTRGQCSLGARRWGSSGNSLARDESYFVCA